MTREQVKAKFNREGMTFTKWAKDNGYGVKTVHLIMCGLSKCQRGISNEIAHKLGLTLPIR